MLLVQDHTLRITDLHDTLGLCNGCFLKSKNSTVAEDPKTIILCFRYFFSIRPASRTAPDPTQGPDFPAQAFPGVTGEHKPFCPSSLTGRK